MWLMSTFEKQILKILFFVSTFLDWYNCQTDVRKNVFLRLTNYRKNVLICLATLRKKWHTMI